MTVPSVSPAGLLVTGGHRVSIPAAIATMIASLYVAWTAYVCLAQAFRPWTAETDMKQAIFQYWRYNIDGAFPPGQLLTDYAFQTHAPPFWWALMAGLSTFVEPTTAANLLNCFTYIATAVAMYFCVNRYSNHYVALAASMLMVRFPQWFTITSGGYARSFGPLFVLTFLALWMRRMHRSCLALLILMAGLYPSVMVPCALAYGVFITVKSLRERKLRPFVQLAATGVICASLGMIYELRAPEWWGKMVTLEEASKLPELRAGGRAAWYPLASYKVVFDNNAGAAFARLKNVPFPSITAFNASNDQVLFVGPAMLGVLAVAFQVWRRRAKPLAGDTETRPLIPFEVPMLFAAAFAGYVLARVFAYKLYIPHRMLAHSWPELMVVAACILAFQALSSTLRRKHLATAIAVALLLGLTTVVSGAAVQGRAYRSYAKDAKLYTWVSKKTPLDAQFAGNLQIMDEIPLFAQRQVFANWKLSHPFRLGYYAAFEKRIIDMYAAYYSPDLKDVVAFGETNDIDYMIVDHTRFEKLESGDGQLYNPLRGKVKPLYERGKREGFALASPPDDVVVFKHRVYKVLDMKKLAAWVAAHPGETKATAPEGTMSPAPSDASDGANDDASVD